MENFIKVARKQYAEIVQALKEAEQEYNNNRKSVSKRENFQFIAAKEMAISELCAELGIELVDDNFNLIS